MILLSAYRWLTWLLEPVFYAVLYLRKRKGKEHKTRMTERTGVAGASRPMGDVIWLHAASVGEAQSALILVDRLLKALPKHAILITSGTVTSANMLAGKLPGGVIHQFYPLDHPRFCQRFLAHWQPNAVLWLESELWPNMLRACKAQAIPMVLVNARMSAGSFKTWRLFKMAAQEIVSVFTLILAQDQAAGMAYTTLGHDRVIVTGNIKYSAAPLPYDEQHLSVLKAQLGQRPVWLYASTHLGEEALAFETHKRLQQKYSDLLTIIVPRHPDRGNDIAALAGVEGA